MKKALAISVCFILSVSIFCACSSDQDNTESEIETESFTEQSSSLTESIPPEDESSTTMEPEAYQIQTICQLATTECYYHNVAKAVKRAGTGLVHLGEEDTPFWFEYTAKAKLGIDFNQVSILIEGNVITISIPHAAILGDITVDPDSTSDPVYPPHRWNVNDVEIGAADVTQSMSDANQEIRDKINSDVYLLSTAENRAKELIANYINQIMALSNTEYSINWVYIDEPLRDSTESEQNPGVLDVEEYGNE